MKIDITDREVVVPAKWLERLFELSSDVKRQIDELTDKERIVFFKTDISALVGYTSSSGTLLKYNRGK